MFNSTQVQTTSAALVAGIAGFLAGRGVFGFDQATWITIFTAAGGLAVSIYTAILTRKTNLVSVVANLPEVSKIEMDKNVVSPSLIADTPENVVAK